MLPRASTDERGFTLTELLIAVVILGIIASSLAAMLNTAVRLAPAAADSSTRSTERTRLADSWSSDVANSDNNVTVPATTNSYQCPSSTSTKPLLDVSWTDGSDGLTTIRAQYSVVFTAQSASLVQADIIRTQTVGPATPTTKTMMSGYCVPQAPNTAVSTNTAPTGTWLNRRLQMTFALSPHIGDPVETTVFEGARGKTGA